MINKNLKSIVIALGMVSAVASAETIMPLKTGESCISLGDTPSLIIKFHDKTSSLTQENFLSQGELDDLSVTGIKFTRSKPMAEGAYVVFFKKQKTSSLLNEVRPYCYTQDSINALIQTIQKEGNVESVRVNALRKMQENIPEQSANHLAMTINPVQWDMLAPPGGIDLQNAWNNGSTGTNAISAVLDTGILNNASLQPNLLPGVTFSDIGGWGLGADPSCLNCSGTTHGTHVSGTVAASGLLVYGRQVFGVAPTSKLLPINVFTMINNPAVCNSPQNPNNTPCLLAFDADIINALSWLDGTFFPGIFQAPTNVVSLNMSLGGAGTCQIQNALDNLINKGKTIVIAAGNDNVDTAGVAPANCNGIIAVAATGPSGERAYYSNWGSTVTLAAPGGNDANPVLPFPTNMILSTVQNDYGYLEGTSMAAPHVAGVVTLLYALNPALNSVQVKDILINNVTPFPTSAQVPNGTVSCIDPQAPLRTCGAGILNANLATAAVAPTPPPPTPAAVTLDQSKVLRNPMQLSQVFIGYIATNVNPSATFTLVGAGGSNVVVTLDSNRNRFIVSNVTNPRAFVASIRITSGVTSVETNAILIPGAL